MAPAQSRLTFPHDSPIPLRNTTSHASDRAYLHAWEAPYIRTALPHPCPLPLGEGESYPVGLKRRMPGPGSGVQRAKCLSGKSRAESNRRAGARSLFQLHDDAALGQTRRVRRILPPDSEVVAFSGVRLKVQRERLIERIGKFIPAQTP